MAKISNRFWFQLHGWFSLPVWIIFCFVCLTGTISVLSHEITWLTNNNARATNPENLVEKPTAELISIVQKAYPSAKITTVMTFEPYLVNAVIFTDKDKPYAIAYVNQYTGDIQSINEGLIFTDFMRSLHGWLLFPWHGSYSVGYYLVCAMAIVMLGALVTGLIIYKNFWRAFTQPKLRFTQGKKTLLADLHRLAGVWSIWFLMLMSLTGLWYLVQAILWHADYDIEPHAPIAQVSQLPLNTVESAAKLAINDIPRPNYTLDNAVEIAKQQFPDFHTTYVMLPEHNRDTFKVYGSGDFIFYDQYSYGLVINPWTGAIESERAPDKMTLLQTLSHIADPLHYGTIGGIWTKIIWFIFGMILTGMSITGFLMWGSRTIKASKTEQVTIHHKKITAQEIQ
ncbi:PepSY-associated TM helix domain-containing protein [Colwellia sp. 4_MG-2023]|uniref:PepSY-associated TM helix domain-containing protein n=1 Tax=unclassified Colwellia TaxID=196834 RepID=UPI001C0944E9|nr:MULTISPECIES: PepSY-associated TM helix domain-containing protein [unclassified Colwellia]MBU2924960.1 PepSY domain-containing protein [Colwellia sp. C2M11]MDO6506859.1 PepSY-associated TM helix domain-containing protein [Colwellia sp. 5_MG-2023]MDO6555766.1 PepSY-associated TM helix domain-containing protein [Colwellia sp. 4_MG-2023]MDO6652807.1 PepSY-associated TM helix domain-containing protein [Colwellia sp. 3_MG-2023]MDO6665810.1 PepSY-associated TM helix domain-containing protein [Col